MKFRSAVRRSTVIVIILAASVLLGYGYQFLCEQLEKAANPREYTDLVSKYSTEYGVPESMLHAVIFVESGYRSNTKSDDGRIGLMQIRPETMDWLNGAMHTRYEYTALYDPEINIRCGAYYLAYLYSIYGRWTPVLAAFETDVDTVTFWSLKEEYDDENGNLVRTPYDDLNVKIGAILDKAEIFRKVYS